MRVRNVSSAPDYENITKSTPSSSRSILNQVGEDDPDEIEFRRKQMEEMNPAAFYGRDFTAGNELRNNTRQSSLPEAKPIPPKPTEAPPTPVYAKKTETQTDANWIRQELPSHCVPYLGRNDVFIRPVDFGQLGMLSSASKNQSITMMVDALSKSLKGLDMRNLTSPDFSFLMYNIRNLSYPATQMKVNYITRYGNKIIVPVNLSALEIVELEMTPDEYQHYYQQGIQFPTVRDMEILFDPDLTDDLKFTLEYAQYMRLDEPMDENFDYGSYIDKKLAKLNEKGVEFARLIDEFAEKSIHGVKEEVKIRDPQFDPLKAADLFEKQATDMVRGINSLVTNNRIDAGKEAPAIAITLIAAELMDEAAALRKKVENNELIEAEEETVAVTITATDFFPPLRD